MVKPRTRLFGGSFQCASFAKHERANRRMFERLEGSSMKIKYRSCKCLFLASRCDMGLHLFSFSDVEEGVSIGQIGSVVCKRLI